MPDLDFIVERMSRVRASLLAVAGSIPAEVWRQPPQPGHWSSGEVIAHLTMVEGTIVSGAARVLTHEPRPLPFWKRAHLPLAIVEWRGIKRKTPIPLDPGLVGEKELMLDRFAAVRQKTLALIEDQHGRDLSPYYWRHPFLGYLNLYEWLEVIPRHETRHTQQLREIVEFFQK